MGGGIYDCRLCDFKQSNESVNNNEALYKTRLIYGEKYNQ